MRIRCRSYAAVLTSTLFWSVTQAVFQDEAFHTDFHLSLIGTVLSPENTFFHRPASSSPASLLYALSNRLVLGAINPKDGSLVWRQQLVTGTIAETEALNSTAIIRQAGDGRIASGVNGEVTLWDASSGKSVWQNSFSAELADIIVLEKEGVVVVAFKDGDIKALTFGNGDVLWESTIGDGQDIASNFNIRSGKLFITLHTPSTGRLKIVSLSLNTGAHLETFNHEFFSSSDSHISVPQFLPFTAVKSTERLKISLLGSKDTKAIGLDSRDYNYRLHAATSNLFIIEYNTRPPATESSGADIYTVDAAGITKSIVLPFMGTEYSAFAITETGQGVYVTRVTMNEVQVYSTESNTPVTTFHLEKSLPTHPTSCVAEIVRRADGAIAVRAAVYLANGDLLLLRNGEVFWTRYESLASAVAAEWVELHEPEESLEKALHTEEQSNVVSAYVHRVTRHVQELKYLPGWLAGLQQNMLRNFGIGGNAVAVDGASVAKDPFGFRKLVVFITRFGYITAIDAGNQGRFVGSFPLDTEIDGLLEKDVKGLFHFKKGILALVLTSGYIYEIDIMLGKVSKKYNLSFIRSANVMTVDSPTLDKRWILAIPTKEGAKGWFYPYEDVEDLATTLSKTWLSLRCGTGVCGYLAKPSGNERLTLNPAWSFAPPASQKLVSVTTSPAHNPVASIGKVLGDRSVLYKYVNPHTMLLITSDQKASVAYLYLIDSVSGTVLHSAAQTDVDTTRPITATMAENWYVYSYYSTSAARGNHLVVTDFYASAAKNDPGRLNQENISSFDQPRSSSPYGLSQAYVFPHEIATMGTTSTRQGITTRAVLLAVPEIGSLLSMNKRFLEPRRPVNREPTNEEKEEGLFKYDPQIQIDHQRGSLSHSRELVGIVHIMTTPSLLESTSLVVAWGLDVFGTRTSPSEAFDILGRGFNKIALIGSVVAVAIGTGFLGPMVRKKQINQRWSQ